VTITHGQFLVVLAPSTLTLKVRKVEMAWEAAEQVLQVDV
jgi:hypothetical protein